MIGGVSYDKVDDEGLHITWTLRLRYWLARLFILHSMLPLHPDSQHLYSFMTPMGLYSPTRVLMSQTDAVGFCQSAVHEMFLELLYDGLLVWLDDLLGYAPSVNQLLDILEKVLTICEKYNLKLHPRKCAFFLTKATWCGKSISSEGVTHVESRVQGLVALATPSTAADLQQFLCATN